MNEPFSELTHTHEAQQDIAEDIIKHINVDNFQDFLFTFIDCDPKDCGEKFVSACHDAGIEITFYDEDNTHDLLSRIDSKLEELLLIMRGKDEL